MRRVFCVAFALVAIFFVLRGAGVAAAVPAPKSLPTYAYGVVLGCQTSDNPVVQRALPSARPGHIAAGQHADDRRSSGTLACSDRAVPPSIHVYDAGPQLLSTDGTRAAVIAATTGRNGEAVEGKLSSLKSGRVAAEGGAASAANGARLASRLTVQEARAVFTESGGLSSEVIGRSTEIINGTQLGNQALAKSLTADGSQIADWGKYTTQTFKSPSGPSQVHSYYNSTTGNVFYGLDYKTVFVGGGP